ncbi:PepSY domain-containing protein [Bacillus badius]|nr:PepSY domain-containing protein [Bacillus badius]KZO01493.1 peptidase M4 [Bacillus badius]KZR59313.1 peptidase M4 [Bacillus badius]MED0665261.1 PepSY domain-containing protein [Bacillus badius]MED4715674.1 PepSY domain-containing protein [Bacillus badius]OCS89830.1 peptidase M4 [Bacillus badius]
MNWGAFLLGAAAGAAGAVIAQQNLSKTTYVSAEKALKEVKEAFKSEGPIDGSWIKMKPEPLKKAGMDKMVYKGGVSRTIGQEREQFEFVADSRTGTIMDVYKTY